MGMLSLPNTELCTISSMNFHVSYMYNITFTYKIQFIAVFGTLSGNGENSLFRCLQILHVLFSFFFKFLTVEC